MVEKGTNAMVNFESLDFVAIYWSPSRFFRVYPYGGMSSKYFLRLQGQDRGIELDVNKIPFADLEVNKVDRFNKYHIITVIDWKTKNSCVKVYARNTIDKMKIVGTKKSPFFRTIVRIKVSELHGKALVVTVPELPHAKIVPKPEPIVRNPCGMCGNPLELAFYLPDEPPLRSFLCNTCYLRMNGY